MADTDPTMRQQIVDAVAEALAKARPMPAPGHVTEVVFRMGAPDAVQALRTEVQPSLGGCDPCPSPPPPHPGELLDELDLSPEDEEKVQQLMSHTGSDRARVLASLLTRALAKEAQARLDELAPGTGSAPSTRRPGSSRG